MAIKEIFEGNTSKVIEATQLLSELSDREGQYVWKKYKVTEEKNKEVAITVTPVTTGNPFHLEVNSEDADLTVVDGAFFVGLKGTYGGSVAWEITSATTMLFGGTSYAIEYEPSTRKLAVHFQESSVGTWVTTNTLVRDVTMKIFDGYVTADDDSSYPNGDVLDGYWYELFYPLTLIPENIREGVDIWGVIGSVIEGLDLSTLNGRSKMAVDKVTFASETSGNASMTHSLGERPMLAFLFALGNVAKNKNIVAGFVYGQSSNYGASISHSGEIVLNQADYEFYSHRSSPLSSSVTNTKIKWCDVSNYKFTAGVEYLMLTYA